MRGSNTWIAALWIAGCAESSVPCEPSGEHLTTAQGEFCLYSAESPLVIEGGFECPARLPFRFDAEAGGGIACAERDLERLPANVCARIGAACESAGGPEPGARPMEPKPGQPPAAEDPWRAVAEERGFVDALEGMDFFAAMQFGCIVDTGMRPATWQALVEESELVMLATIEGVDVVPDEPQQEVPSQDVYLRLDVQEIAKGEPAEPILVRDNCSHGGKVAPLRERIPADELVFLLHAPEQARPDLPAASDLLYYYLGIVREQDGGVRYALGDEQAGPPLDDFDSTRALLDAVRALQP